MGSACDKVSWSDTHRNGMSMVRRRGIGGPMAFVIDVDYVVVGGSHSICMQLEDGEEVREGRPNRQGITRGWRSPRMEAVAAIRRKTGDGGDAPVIEAGHTTHGWMGGLPGAPNRWEFVRGRKNGDGRSVASLRRDRGENGGAAGARG
jgi:hypothetical protein